MAARHMLRSPWNFGVKKAGSAKVRPSSISCSGSDLAKGRLLPIVITSERRGLP